MTVQDLIDWCDEHGRSYGSTEIYVYANSSLGDMPAILKGEDDYRVYLDYC